MNYPIYTELPIQDAFVIEYRAFSDSRGYLAELYNSNKYKQAETENLQQITLSQSKKNVLRGIHKVPYSKLVTCVRGAIYDVIVDLRHNSPTFLMWVSIVLTQSNHKQLYIPADCGHAFLSLENDTLVVYGQSQPFNPALEDNCRFDDPFVNVYWHLDIAKLEISPKDRDTALLIPDNLPKGLSPHRTRILIIGASGQLGSILTYKLQKYYQLQYVVYGTYCNNKVDTHCVKMDLNSSSTENTFSYHSLLQLCHPNIVIICAAMTWVDGCEKSQNKAYDINCNAVFSLSLEAKKIGAKTIYISTDYVFGGVLPIYGDKYMEEDTISPLNVYGKTKHRGEQFVLSISKDNLVVRTSSLFGPDKLNKNFPCQVVRKLKDNLKFPAFSHVVSTPTYTVDLAECIIQLLVHDCSGVMHLAGPESASKYDWALKIANSFNLENTLIEKVDSFPALVAKRPLNSSLANNRIGYILPEFKFRGIQDALEDWMINFPDSLDDIVNPTKSKL
ncbi:hypothetical protein LOD99_3452 [Oopsacas minuta]|uniref:Methionine adenosyltransferase 2 subunit beta n=1 Tax=Oopsacas minuta TaxID=111878 RepID=A0AAV7JXF5_9METZ|nr:hypothetical protein LOD99_3452 [Oopsacas minuta]